MKFEIFAADDVSFRWRVIKTGPGTSAGAAIIVVAQSGLAFSTRDAAQADYNAFAQWVSRPPA